MGEKINGLLELAGVLKPDSNGNDEKMRYFTHPEVS